MFRNFKKEILNRINLDGKIKQLKNQGKILEKMISKVALPDGREVLGIVLPNGDEDLDDYRYFADIIYDYSVFEYDRDPSKKIIIDGLEFYLIESTYSEDPKNKFKIFILENDDCDFRGVLLDDQDEVKFENIIYDVLINVFYDELYE